MENKQETVLLYELAGYLNSTLELDAVLLRAMNAVQRYLQDIHCIAISTLESGNILHTRVEWVDEPTHSMLPSGTRTPISVTHTSQRTLQLREPYIIPDLARFINRNTRLEAAFQLGLRTLFYVPLLAHDRVIGILHLFIWDVPRHFSQQEIAFCQSIANHAAIAIENAQLYAESRQQTQTLRILNEVVMATAVMLDIDKLLTKTTELIVANLYSNIFGFALFDSDEVLHFHASYYGIDEAVKKRPIPVMSSIIGHVAKTGQPYVCHDVSREPKYYEGVATTRSEIAVPLIVKGFVIGVLNVESPELNAFSDHDMQILGILAGQVATAIERAQLYDFLRQSTQRLARKVKEQTKALRYERDRTLAILESAGEGILFTDVAGRILYANMAVTQQSGYTSNELLNTSTNIFRSQRTPDKIFDEMWQTLLAGKRWSGEIVNQRKDGTLYDVNTTISPVKGEGDKVTGFVSVMSDIGHFKEVERLKAQFVSNVSHELRTPITNIKTFAKLIERGTREKRAQYLKILYEESDRLADLIQDLLDLSRLETDKRVDNTAVTNFQQLIQTISQTFAIKAEAKKMTIETDSLFEPLIATIETRHAAQLLTNLIGNALAYAPEETVVTMTGGWQARQGEDMIWVTVQNRGPIITADEMPHLFERFYRGEAAQRTGSPGSGLGLPICYEIVSRYGGHIEVTSDEVHGTRFTIWLKAAHAYES